MALVNSAIRRHRQSTKDWRATLDAVLVRCWIVTNSTETLQIVLSALQILIRQRTLRYYQLQQLPKEMAETACVPAMCEGLFFDRGASFYYVKKPQQAPQPQPQLAQQPQPQGGKGGMQMPMPTEQLHPQQAEQPQLQPTSQPPVTCTPNFTVAGTAMNFISSGKDVMTPLLWIGTRESGTTLPSSAFSSVMD